RVSEWVSRKRLGSLSIDALFAAGLKELQPALLYSVGGLLAVLYLGGSVWLFTSSGETRMPSSRHGGGTSAVVDPSGARTDQRFVDAPGDGFLSIRSEPTVRTGERLGRVPHGDPVRVLDAQPVRDTIEGIAGNWVRVRYQGISGWVFDGYLRDSSPLAAGRGAGGAYTPQRGTAERQAILDAARAQVASDLGYDAPFLFVVDHLKVYQGWALFRGKPTDQDGRMLSRGCEDADEVTMVLLRERNAAWNVEAGGTVCTTDVFWAGWTDYLGAPAEIF
ncbi:MAG: SH3 domain-containing protein, partial [Bacteroidota bacterium]